MAFYRSTASVTPKLHMLEDHVLPFLQEWRVGFDFHGEQGAESLHALIKRISALYMSIPNRLERLKGVVQEHHLLQSWLHNNLQHNAENVFHLHSSTSQLKKYSDHRWWSCCVD